LRQTMHTTNVGTRVRHRQEICDLDNHVVVRSLVYSISSASGIHSLVGNSNRGLEGFSVLHPL
jgi:hypothetical protein